MSVIHIKHSLNFSSFFSRVEKVLKILTSKFNVCSIIKRFLAGVTFLISG